MTRARARRWLSGASVMAALVALAACTVTPTTPAPRYFLLEAPAVAVTPLAAPALAVAVGPVTVADYLDQPLMVTRAGDNEVVLHEQHRWAMPLARSVPELLREVLAHRLPAARVTAFAGPAAASFDRRVVVELSRLDGAPGSAVTLAARWQVLDRSGAPLRSTGVALEGSAGAGFAAYVAAQAALVAGLADAIAAELARDAGSGGDAPALRGGVSR